MLRYYEHKRLIEAYYLDTNPDYFVYKNIKYKRTDRLKRLYFIRMRLPHYLWLIGCVISMYTGIIWFEFVCLCSQWFIRYFTKDIFVEEALNNIIGEVEEDEKQIEEVE